GGSKVLPRTEHHLSRVFIADREHRSVAPPADRRTGPAAWGHARADRFSLCASDRDSAFDGHIGRRAHAAGSCEPRDLALSGRDTSDSSADNQVIILFTNLLH